MEETDMERGEERVRCMQRVTWKQPRCLSTDEWIKEAVVHIHNGILLSHKKECIWVSSDEVDELRTYYTE